MINKEQGGVQASRLFGDKIDDSIPGLNEAEVVNKDENHLIKYASEGEIDADMLASEEEILAGIPSESEETEEGNEVEIPTEGIGNPGGLWKGPIRDAIMTIIVRDPQVGLTKYTAELVSENEILYSCYFSQNTLNESIGIKAETYRVNVPYQISKIDYNGEELDCMDNAEWRTAFATGDLRSKVEAARNATNIILKIEPKGEPIVIDNRAGTSSGEGDEGEGAAEE
jgi:hypothetical protein